MKHRNEYISILRKLFQGLYNHAGRIRDYIVKDYGDCLAYVTNFSGAEDVFEAAQSIVESFVWADGIQNEEWFQREVLLTHNT